MLTNRYGVDNITVIPTGVGLGRFPFHAPEANGRVVFTGSMDSMPNIDAIGFMMDDIWGRASPTRIRTRP